MRFSVLFALASAEHPVIVWHSLQKQNKTNKTTTKQKQILTYLVSQVVDNIQDFSWKGAFPPWPQRVRNLTTLDKWKRYWRIHSDYQSRTSQASEMQNMAFMWCGSDSTYKEFDSQFLLCPHHDCSYLGQKTNTILQNKLGALNSFATLLLLLMPLHRFWPTA